jgi:ectoine hydroxylase-related dioxygenase (phytanoyl-CoA dioxygenase family)
MELTIFANVIEERGWATTPAVFGEAEVAALREAVAPLAVEGRGGARNLLAHPRVRALAVSSVARSFAADVLGEACFAVRAILFDKTPSANWKVVWHQDLSIATRQRVDMPGFGPWTEKAGVTHVQPPVAVLEHMLALRVHLDDCGPHNGPVRVIDGSHRHGRLSGTQIDMLRRSEVERDCLVEQGAILAFRPLILHSSAPAIVPAHRRVIHIEYAACELPAPLEWYDRVAWQG